MGYYCTVPQCTSLAGKTKNVKFHRFPRDEVMADKWNVILKRGKPYTKYSKVCSLHFTQADYNVTTMGQWKTLSKDAVPSQNLPKLHPDGSVMVIRKSRTVKYKDHKKEDTVGSKSDKWPVVGNPMPWSTPDRTVPSTEPQDSPLSYRLQKLNDLANIISPQETHQTVSPPQPSLPKPKKQDAIMQTDPLQPEEEELLQNSYSESSEKSYSPDHMEYQSQYSKDEYSKDEYTDQDQYPEDQNYPKDQIDYKDQNYPKDQIDFKDQNYPKDQIDYKDQNYPKDQIQFKDQNYPKDQIDFKDQNYPKEDFKEQLDYSKDQYSKEESFPKDQESFSKDYEDDYAQKKYEMAKDYTKPADDYIPQTNEEYNKEAEKYALERKSHNGYEKGIDYQKQMPIENGYQKMPDIYAFSEKQADFEPRTDGFAPYQNTYADSVELLRSQQHNLHMLQEHHRINENQNFFNENHIKQEIDFGNEEEKFMYDRNKEPISKYDADLQSEYERQLMEQRILQQMHHQVKQEPDTNNGCESVMQPQTSPYYSTNGHTNVTGGYYAARPGPELLIAKQNALAAHTQLWQNTMKRPFFYSDSTHYAPQLLHRYEDVTRIQQ